MGGGGGGEGDKEGAGLLMFSTDVAAVAVLKDTVTDAIAYLLTCVCGWDHIEGPFIDLSSRTSDTAQRQGHAVDGWKRGGRTHHDSPSSLFPPPPTHTDATQR